VHAIRQPLTAPAFRKPVAVRLRGQTSARIIDRLTIDRPSTGKVDLMASWTEQVDLPSQPAPVTRTGGARAFEAVAHPEAATGDVLPVDDRHELQDTRYRRVTYTPVGTTRFAEYFVQRAGVRLNGGTPAEVSAAGIVPGTDVVRLNGRTFVRDTDYTIDYPKGTITRAGGAIPDGATVEVAHVAPPITRDGAPVVVDVPSSARPVAPDVAYVVPTFGWQDERSPSGITSTRRGNGLRVFLRRPWFSSGDGEKLGVLVLNEAGEVPADLGRYVTTWAQDPAWRSTRIGRPPLVTDFPLAAHPRANLTLAESEKDDGIVNTVSVAPHEVVYDAERQLWFCDITLAVPQPAPYSPFVRLALARYQPVSVAGVELSSVVQAQFTALNPDRALSVVFTDQTRLAVSVTGLTYTPVPGKDAARLTAVVQTADPTLPGNVAWRDAGPPVVLTTGSAGGQTTWSGTVPLPAPRGSQPFRLVIQEYENLTEGGRRLVYTDAVQL
jgi:hypothetical protein